MPPGRAREPARAAGRIEGQEASGASAVMSPRLEISDAVGALKAAAEPTRLRMLLLLAGGELNVKDLTRILGQSQPRISRHLKLLAEAGLVDRFREGSWVYFHLSEQAAASELLRRLGQLVDSTDRVLQRDRERLDAIKRERAAAAQVYFRAHAAEWDRIRALHVEEAVVEQAVREAVGPRPVGLLLDLGTGTGRMLELLADRADRGIGVDVNQAMLAFARARLDAAGLGAVQVRHGDIYDLAIADRAAGLVVMHQVLHFLIDPARAIREAARLLAPGGRLLIVDFAPHEIEFLRERHAHERLGFAPAQIVQWLKEAGLAPVLTRTLAPPAGSGEGKLSVSIWLAEREGAAVAAESAPAAAPAGTRPPARTRQPVKQGREIIP
jgi:ArsR family transcriptional regulator